jgi:hypothetical protein
MSIETMMKSALWVPSGCDSFKMLERGPVSYSFKEEASDQTYITKLAHLKV